MDGANVEAIRQVLQQAGVGVDHGDVVVLVRKIFRERGAHLSGTENDDFHEAASAENWTHEGRDVAQPAAAKRVINNPCIPLAAHLTAGSSD